MSVNDDSSVHVADVAEVDYRTEPWTEYNIGTMSHFRGIKIAGIGMSLSTWTDAPKTVIHYYGEHHIELPVEGRTAKTHDLELAVVKLGLQKIDEHRREYIEAARVMGYEI